MLIDIFYIQNEHSISMCYTEAIQESKVVQIRKLKTKPLSGHFILAEIKND